MKKIFLTIASAALLASCTLSEPDNVQTAPEQGKPVSFSTYCLKTRAAEIDIADLQQSGFLMYANVNDPNSSKPVPFMNAQKINYAAGAAGAGEWVYAPIKYWPTTDGASVDFYPRYTDGSDNVKITYDWNNVPQVTFFVNNTVSKQTDMLWAAPIFKAKPADYENRPVEVNFKHALTSFYFTIRLAKEYANTKVKVKAVNLEGYFAPKATMNVTTTDIKKVWDLLGDWDKRSYVISVDGEKEITDAAANGIIGTEKTPITDEKGCIMVLPFNDTEYTVTLDYDIEVTHDGHVTTNSYSVSYTNSNANLEAGKKIVSNLVLTLNPINFSASLSEWEKTEVELSNIATIADLTAAFENGGNFTLVNDLTLPADGTSNAPAKLLVKPGTTVHLNLNGKTIKPAEGLDGLAGGLIRVNRKGTLILEGDGIVDAGESYAAIQLTDKNETPGEKATVIINGGTYIGKIYAITGNGMRHNTEVIINDGTFTSKEGIAIYHPQEGDLTINGGNFIGNESVIELRAGKLKITGGSFKSTFEGPTTCVENGSGSTTEGAAIAVVQHGTEKPIDVQISGGTFETANPENYSFYQNTANGGPTGITLSISGGTFKNKVFSYDFNGYITGGKFYKNDGLTTEIADGYSLTGSAAPYVVKKNN